MNRWAARIVGLILLLIFALLFLQMHRTLVMLQRQQQSSPAPTST